MAEKDISIALVGTLLVLTVILASTATWLTLRMKTTVPEDTRPAPQVKANVGLTILPSNTTEQIGG